jgi:arylsulfatase A-like enzyme
MSNSSKFRLSWRRLFTQTILAIYGYVFLEWLFFATKPSFMDAMPVWKKLEVFLLTGLVLLVLVLPVLLVLRLLGCIPGFLKKRQVFLFIGEVLPAVLAAAVSVLLIDNFTYTLFKVGIVTSSGIARGLYGLIAIVLLVVWYRQSILNTGLPTAAVPVAGISALNNKRSIRWQNAQTWLAVGLMAVSLGISLTRTAVSPKDAPGEQSKVGQRQPHIILIGSDGVVANRMSLYGYERDTTPRLNQLAGTSLLAENNFTNSASTTGSVFSIMTGKYPTLTRLLYSPDILQGGDAYQHLPGILQRAGYKTVEIAFPYYVDAYDINMQEGFDEVNGRTMLRDDLSRFARRFHGEDIGYFVPRLYERISDRLLHIFYIRAMSDPYRQVNKKVDPDSIPQLDDQQKIDKLMRLLRNADQPTFVHVHLMGTHGEQFWPRRRVFSVGESQDRSWMTDFYDDSVLDYDAYLGELVDELTRSNLIDQTVIIIYSDHADQWRANDKIPLLFHFPRGEFSGEISNNTHNVDIAPTLLDYLGMEVPTWMSGQSLLKGEPVNTRPILSFGVNYEKCEGWWCVVDPTQNKAPFYQFDFVQVVICQNMYHMDLDTHVLSSSLVNNHTAPCEKDDLPSSAQVRAIIREHLQANGFDVSTLK